MMRVALLALAACVGPPAPLEQPAVVELPKQIVSAPVAPQSATVGFAARTTKIESRHAAEIRTLAVTQDGTGVLSADELGGVRLWPVLDGSEEPRVVDLPTGSVLAIGSEPRGFVAATIDLAGGLAIAVIDRDGLVKQRASLPAEPAFIDVVTSSRGLLAVRADHSISLIDSNGAVTERIAAASGERITTVVTRGDKVVVQLEGEKRRLRWLTVGPKLAWGAWIASSVPPEGVVAVSPRGTLVALAVGEPAQRKLVVINGATGALVDGESLAGNAPFDIAFADEDHIVVGTRGATRVHAIDRKAASPEVPASAPTVDDPNTLVAGGERVITAASAELAIVSRTGKDYLGYEIEAPSVAAGGPNGSLMIGIGTQFAQLDAGLATAATPDFKLPALSSVAELRHLDGDAWLVEWANLDTGRTVTALVDLVTGARQELHQERDTVHTIGYNATSRLVTFGLGETAEVLRYDPGKPKLARVATATRTRGQGQTDLIPLTPSLADGMQMLVATVGSKVALRWVPDARSLDKGTSLELDGVLASTDTAGNAYMIQPERGTSAIVIYRNGKRVISLASNRLVGVSAAPAGTRFVEITATDVSLVTADGTRTWMLPVVGVNEVLWLSDGALALVGTGGVARVDASNGTVAATRCGWRFGLAKVQHRSSSRIEPMCTQLR